MYLTRFKKWNVHKNTSAEAKDTLCTRLLEDYANGRDMPHLTVKQLRKLLRHCRSKSTKGWTVINIQNLLRAMEDPVSVPAENRLDCLTTDLSNDSTDDNQSDMTPRYTPSSSSTPESTGSSQFEPATPLVSLPGDNVGELPRQFLSSTGKYTALEEVLRLTRAYYGTKLQQYALSRATSNNPDMGAGATFSCSLESSICSASQNRAFWTNVKSGIYFMKMKSYHLAWPLLRKAGEMVPLLCEQQPFALLKHIYSTISPINTRICPAIRIEQLRLFARSAYERLGPNHPFPTICYRLWMDEGSDEMSTTALYLMLEDCEKVLPTGDVELFELKRTIVRFLRRTRDFSKAETLSLSLIEGTEMQHGKNDVKTRLAISELVYILNDQSRYEEALAIARDVVYRGQQDQGHAFPDEQSVYAMEDVAEVCEKLGRTGHSIFWLRKALRGALNMWSNKPATIHIFDKLETLCGKKGRELMLEEPRLPNHFFHLFT